ncbi:WxL domain-containing protein [Enterococcus gallinarum]|uniref:WxL domain-containing protein n=1 Tax=Enterococcus gallinarum TaxID=1353 RepID=UPI00214B2804|nr:WxL domain-containing protein [Enterococcus gallinarum]MCR1928068.1 WxL domain-containing protein [Enterococcus gallinarum]
MKFSKTARTVITLSSMFAIGSTYAFANEQIQSELSEATTPLQGNLDLSENGGHDPNPPSDLNKKTEINNSYFGISYVPSTFDFGTTKLQDSVNEQTIITKHNEEKEFHVGVKDKRRGDTQSWSLNVKHNINIDNDYQGINLTIPTDGEVQRNMNDGITPFKEGDLVGQVQKNGQNEVNKTENEQLTITSEDKTIMYANGGQFVNGVYDLELGDVSLQIPDPSRVPDQTFKGNVTWTLVNTPMKQHYLTSEIRNLFKDGNCTTLKTDIRCSDVEAAKNSIETVQNTEQKEYNKSYFEKYVAPCFIEWDLYGNYNFGTDIYVGNAKYFKLADNSRAGIFFDKSTTRKPHDGDGWRNQEYIRFSVKRENTQILGRSFKASDTSIWTGSIEVKPGDTIEIFHKEGTGHRLTAYPSDYKPVEPIEAYEATLKFKVNEDLSLEAIE